MGRRQIWSFAWLLLGSALPWHLPQYPGLAIHSFVCRMYVLVQLMCLDNISRFSLFCPILRHMLWPSSSSQALAAPSGKISAGGRDESGGGVGNMEPDWGSGKSSASFCAARNTVPVVVSTNRVGSVTLPTKEPQFEPPRRHSSQLGAPHDAPFHHQQSLLSPTSPSSAAGSVTFPSPVLASRATFESAQSNQSSSGHMPNVMVSRQD